MPNIFNSIGLSAASQAKVKVLFPGGNPAAKAQAYVNEFGRVVNREVRIAGFLIQRDAKLALNEKDSLRGSPITNTGQLRDSIKVDIAGDGASTRAIVYVGKEYGVWVEFGRRGLKSSPTGTNHPAAARANWPPFRPILQWVKDRKLRPKGSGLGRGKVTGRFMGVTQADQESIAFVIQRHIAEHGIQPQPFLMPAYQRHVKTFRERIANAVRGIKV